MHKYLFLNYIFYLKLTKKMFNRASERGKAKITNDVVVGKG